MFDDLSRLAADDIDSLPFGYIALSPGGEVRKYNRFEADLSRRNPEEVLGRNFFREVAPCTQVAEFEGRFRAFAAGEISAPHLDFEFEFRFRHGAQRVRIGFVRSPLEREVIVTVHKVVAQPITRGGELTPDVARGLLLDAEGVPVTLGNADFWRALVGLWRHLPAAEGREALTRLGATWARAHLERVDRWAQREHGVSLREAELQLALEAVSGSLGPLGLGRFEVDFRHRERGLVVVRHFDSPFARIHDGEDEPVCSVLRGVFAAVFSYLAGQPLAAVELACSRVPGTPCVFAVGTERRLLALQEAEEPSPEARLRASLSSGPGVVTARWAPAPQLAV